VIHAQLQLLLHDPMRGKMKHGEFSALVSRLLQQWINERKANVSREIEETTGVARNA
jgi:hypothetical protein